MCIRDSSEVGLVSVRPAAKRVVDLEEIDLRELRCVLLGDLLVRGAIEVLARDLLAFRRIEIVQIGFSNLAGAFLVDVLVDHSEDVYKRQSPGCRPRQPR